MSECSRPLQDHSLCVPTTCVPVDRVFSEDAHNETKRAQMGDPMLEMVMYLRSQRQLM